MRPRHQRGRAGDRVAHEDVRQPRLCRLLTRSDDPGLEGDDIARRRIRQHSCRCPYPPPRATDTSEVPVASADAGEFEFAPGACVLRRPVAAPSCVTGAVLLGAARPRAAPSPGRGPLAPIGPACQHPLTSLRSVQAAGRQPGRAAACRRFWRALLGVGVVTIGRPRGSSGRRRLSACRCPCARTVASG